MPATFFRTLAVLALLHQAALAVVVLSGAPNTSAPAGQPYFHNIGSVNGATGVYLSDRWVITASHVAPGLPASATFGGNTYFTETGTFHQLQNPLGSGLSTFTDVVLFRLGADPGLPSLSIATVTPTVASPVMMIGAGRQQESALTYWQVTPIAGDDNDIWAELTPPDPNINHTGFKTTDTQVVRWGTNHISTADVTINYNHGDVRSFMTTFDSGALADEAQAVNGDSGGAVLAWDGGTWNFSGLIVAVQTHENQPDAGIHRRARQRHCRRGPLVLPDRNPANHPGAILHRPRPRLRPRPARKTPPLTARQSLSTRARIHSRSASLLKNNLTASGTGSPDSCSARMLRSARRATERAKSTLARAKHPSAPGRAHPVNRIPRASYLCASPSTHSTSAISISGNFVPRYRSSSSGSVASCPISPMSFSCNVSVSAIHSGFEADARATPSAAFSSSTQPSASIRSEVFAMRLPNNKSVSPASPRPVMMLMHGP